MWNYLHPNERLFTHVFNVGFVILAELYTTQTLVSDFQQGNLNSQKIVNFLNKTYKSSLDFSTNISSIEPYYANLPLQSYF